MSDPGVPNPAMDPQRFLADVTRDIEFCDTGVRVGRAWSRGLRLHWAVVDPARQSMSVWRKPVPSFVKAAAALDASIVTNGPFTDYATGPLGRATAHAVVDGARAAMTPGSSFARAAHRAYEATRPLGHVVGARDGIRETTVDRPRLHHFGRRDAAGFGAYVIAQGDGDPSLVESVGGLFRCVRDHRQYTVKQHIRVGYWGLAPFRDNRVVRPSQLPSEMDGVIVFLGGFGSTQRLSALFASIGVQDGVQIDGGDSLLLRDATRFRVGSRMPPWKRALQRWGICFRP